jgi:CheY-like chemotaxis protein
MAKQQILLVDADSSSARLLEVSLRSAGFTVAVASSAEGALAKLEHGVPDLILTDTRLPGADGFAFVQKLRGRAELAEVPVVFLTEQGALDDKLRGLELGVDDYLAKPIMVREVVTRVQLLLARKRQQRIAAEPQARTRFSGSLEDVAVVDLLQTIAVSGKSGVASVKRGEREAWLYFDRGQIIDAEVGDLQGEEAVYRVITWTTGIFDLEFRAIERPRVIDVPQAVLLMEGLRRVDELGRLAEQLPPETAVVDIDHEALASRLNEIPDELNGILRLIDGKRTLVDLIDASPFDDLSTLTVLSKFYFEGLLRSANPEPVEWAPGSRQATALRSEPGPPSSGAALEAAPTLVPPSSGAPRSAPLQGEPARESQRFLPAPFTARAPVDPDAKLTPKGIVNVGDSTPPPPKSLPSPFRAANDAPRRSPIPMPDSALRANGSSHHGPDAQHSNGVRQSRTMHGLSAASVRELSPTADLPPSSSEGAAAGVAPSWRQSRAAGASPTPPEPQRGDDTEHAAAEHPVERSRLAAPVRLPPSAREPSSPTHATSSAGDVPGSAPGSNPESEQEFFEAGDEGTYAGGPRSGVPVPHFDHDLDRPTAAVQGPALPLRRLRTRRSTLIVASVLVLSAVPLIAAAWRQFVAERPASMEDEPSAMTAAAQSAPAAVKQPGNTGDDVASPASAVSPGAAAEGVGADAATPMVADGSVPLAGTMTHAPATAAPSEPAAAVSARPSAPEPSARSASEPASSKATKASPAPRPPVRSLPQSSKPADPKPPNSAETPFIPPFEVTPPKAEPRPGEKPPTAAYPLH